MLGCVIRPGVCGGVKVEGKSKDGRVDTMRLKNLGGIESGGGVLSSGGGGMEIPTSSFPSLVCNFCVTIISKRLLLKSFKVVC